MKRRSLVLLACSVAIVSGCDQRADAPAKEKVKENEFRGKAAIASSNFMVEPISAAAAAFSIANSLKGLFSSGRNGDIDAIRGQLDRISAQNDQILRTLNQIAEVLDNLGVTVRQNVRLENIFEKQAALSGEFRDTYATWKAEINDPRARREATRIYTEDILGDVKNLADALIHPDYGYAAFDSVGGAMLNEMWISWRIRQAAEIRKQRASVSYLPYFDRALNPQLEATPARQLADAIAQRDRMKAILDEADRIVGNGWTKRVRVWTERRNHTCRQDRVYEYALDETASGSQASGYSVASNQLQLRDYLSPSGETDCGKGGPRDFNFNLVRTDPPVPTADTPSAKVPYWNSVLRTYREASANVTTLTKVNQTLRLYRDEAYARSQTG